MADRARDFEAIRIALGSAVVDDTADSMVVGGDSLELLRKIRYRDLEGDVHGMNAWPASGRDLAPYQ